MSHMWSGLSKQWSLLQPQEVTQEKHSSSCICICICICISTGKALLSSREAQDTWRCQEGSDVVDVWTRWALLLTPTLVHVKMSQKKSTLLKRQVHRLIYDNYGSKLYERVQAVQNWSDKVQYGPRWSKIVIWICVPEIFSGTSSLLSTHFSGGGERFRRDGGAHGCFAP